MKPKPLTTLDDHRKRFKSDKAAARDLGADYMTYRHWLYREAYSPENSAWRRLLLATHKIDLPRKS